MPDQTAIRITGELVKLLSRMGLPNILHSDQGRNFESTILTQTLETFGMEKSHTTAYHPQGDSMVERFNRSLLQLLLSYVSKESDWERYLPFVLYAYRTAVHSSTGVSPFVLMFGRQPKSSDFPPVHAFEPSSYQAHLQAKLSELQDLVELNTVEAAHQQKIHYDQHTGDRPFKTDDPVWLSIPNSGKLSPRWEGGWRVKSAKSAVTVEITDGKRTKIVYTNCLQHRSRLQDQTITVDHGIDSRTAGQWNPPQIEHVVIPPDAPTQARRYPIRIRCPPDRLNIKF